MSVLDVIMLRRVYGDEAARAVMARNILAPVASQLSGDPSDLHRRCVLVEHLDMFAGPEDVRAALAPFGAVEAVAVCHSLQRAVVVFSAAADAASALATLRGPWKRSIGLCGAVPPLDLAPAYDFVSWADVKVVGPHGSTATASATSGTRAAPQPTPEQGASTRPFQKLLELKPMIIFEDPSAEARQNDVRAPRSKKEFSPSSDSLVHGPTLGSDGHLWMHGTLVTSDECGIEINHSSIRVKQQIGRKLIRVTPLDPLVYVLWEEDRYIAEICS